MLLLKKNAETASPGPNLIHPNFTNDYLELIRLLNEAAAVEHLLMLQYLYAAFSIKEQYKDVRGSVEWKDYIKGAPQRKKSLLRVAIEEMQHLKMVNDFLSALGASPNLVPAISEEVSDVYPFEIKLTPLSLQTTATYLYVEADNTALDPNYQHSEEEKKYVAHVRSFVNNPPTNHIGSLYASIIKYTHRVLNNQPAFLKKEFIDWNKFQNNMLFIKEEGEMEHYLFFKEVFTASHPGFNNIKVWDYDISSVNYPSIQFIPDQTTAYFGKPDIIKDPVSRKIAWLSNLHYWIILGLLDINYRINLMTPKYMAIGIMTDSLYKLGVTLAERNIGVPFDPMNIHPNVGKTSTYSFEILNFLIAEAREKADRLGSHLGNFNHEIYPVAISELKEMMKAIS